MSNNVDQRIVQMDFDNAKFERGVKTTLESLTKLKDKLDSTSGKNLSKLSDTPVAFKGIEQGIEKLNAKFSTMGTIWTTVVGRATNAAIDKFSGAIQQIKSGGAQRAANIDQATFMLRGLIGEGKKADKELEKVKQNAMDAVDGTAYGFDSAAKAAAQFYASGMKGGEQMEGALKGVAGVAAMTGSSFDDIAQIFTTVAGQGKVTAEQWNQLASRGLNGAANMAKQLGITEKEVRDMTSKGQISFEMFAEAMDKAFGEHAKKANETFEGSLSNMKAALSRVGAEFFTPYRAHMIKVFNSITPLINSLKKTLSPVVVLFDEMFGGLTNFVTGTLAKMNVGFESFGRKMQAVANILKTFKLDGKTSFIQGFIESFGNIKNAIAPFISAIQTAFEQVFGFGSKLREHLISPIQLTSKEINKFKKHLEKGGITGLSKSELQDAKFIGLSLGEVIKKFRDLTSSLKANERVVRNFKDTFGGLFAIVDIVGQALSAVIKGIFPGAKAVGGFADAILSLTGTIGRALMTLDRFLKEIGVFKALSFVIRVAIGIVAIAVKKFTASFSTLVTLVSTFVNDHLDSFIYSIRTFTKHFSNLANIVRSFIVRHLNPLISTLSVLKSKVISQLLVLFRSIQNRIETFAFGVKLAFKLLQLSFGGSIMDAIKRKLDAFIAGLKLSYKFLQLSFGGSILGGITKRLETFATGIKLAFGFLKLSLHGTLDDIKIKIQDTVSHLKELAGVKFKGLVPKLKEVGSAIKDNISDKLGSGFKGFDISGVASGASNGVKTLIAYLAELKNKILEFYDLHLSDKLKPLQQLLEKFFKDIGISLSKFKDASLTRIGESLRNFFNAIKGVASGGNAKVALMIGDFGDAIAKFFRALDTKDVKNAASGIATAIALFEEFKKIEKKSKESVTVVGGLKKFVNTLNSTIASYKKSKITKAEMFRKIAEGILIIAGAIYVISSIPVDQLKVAVGVLTFAVVGIGILIKVLESDGMRLGKDMNKFAAALAMPDAYKKISDSTEKIDAMASMVIKMAAAILLIAGAFTLMGQTQDLGNSIWGMITVMTSLGLLMVVVNELSKKTEDFDPDKFKAMTAAMTSIGVAVIIMAKAMDILSNIPTDKVGQAIAGLMAIMGMMSLFALVVSKGGSGEGGGSGGGSFISAASAMILLAGAVVVLAAAATIMAFLPVQGLIAAGVALAAFCGVLWVISKVSAGLKEAAVFVKSLAEALLLVALAAFVFMGVDTAGMIKAGVALVALLAVLALFGALVSKFPAIAAGLAEVTASIILVSAALLIMAVALRVLNGIKFSEMIGGILSLAVVLGVLALACIAFTAGIVGAVALIFVASALGILALAIGALAAIPSDTIVEKFQALATALAAFILQVGAISTIAGPGLALLGIGIAALGLGVWALAYGLEAMIPLMLKLPIIAPMIEKGLKVVDTIIRVLSEGFKVAGIALLVFGAGALVAGLGATVLAAGLKKVGVALLVVALGIAALAVSIGLLAVAIMLLGAAVTNSGADVMKSIRTVAATILDIIFSLINSMLKNIPVVGDKLSGEFSKWGKNLVDKVAGKDVKKAGEDAPKEVAKGIKKNKGQVDKATKNLIDNKTLEEVKKKGKKVGEGGGKTMTTSLEKTLKGSKIKGVDPNKMLGDFTGDSKKVGKNAGNVLPKEMQSVIGGKKINAKNLAKTTASSATDKGLMKDAAGANLGAYNDTIGDAKGVHDAGKKVGKKGAKAAKNYDGFHSAGKYSVDGYIDGILSKIDEVYSASYRVGKKAVEGGKAGAEVNSPSKAFIRIGHSVTEGFVMGMEETASAVYVSAYGLAEGVGDTVSTALAGVYDAVSGEMDFDPTIRPVVDLSDVKTSAAMANSMFNSAGLRVSGGNLRLAGSIDTQMNKGESKLYSALTELNTRLAGVTDTMNARKMINNITVNGSENPEEFADRMIDEFRLYARTV